MHLSTKSLLLASALALLVPLSSTVSASEHHHADRDDHSHVMKVALWGDMFYFDPAIKASKIDQTISSMNEHNVDFTLFAGDTKNGSSLCTDQAIGADVIDIFNRLDAPTLYSLGDNEWTDCHRANNGAYDPLERLDYLRATFFSKNTSQGKHPIRVKRQGRPGQAYSENSRFVKNRVEFVALHIPGSNNNLVASESQCIKKTGRAGRQWDSVNNMPLDECAAASEEYQARNQMNIEWLRDSFANARARNLAGVLIVIQADVFFPFELSDGGYQDQFLASLDSSNGYSDFVHTLIEETQSYNGQVVLVHGDSHYFKLDKAMYDADGRLTANFTRVEVFGSKDNDWVEMTVDPKSDNVFSFKPVMLTR
jgi:hypothetical protein